MALSSRALCTLVDLKGELGITNDTNDTRLERLIESATNAIERYCGRSNGFHYEAARVDDLRGFSGPLMHLPKTPVVSIASIVWDPDDANDTIDSSLYALDEATQGRVYREDGWHWTAAYQEYLVDTPLPGTEQRLYRVTYACGYVTAKQAQDDALLTRNLPHDLEDACLQLASLRYRWNPRDPNVTAEKIGSWSASYGGTAGVGAAIPDGIAGLLASHKRVVFA